jgi:hypothetical protein
MAHFLSGVLTGVVLGLGAIAAGIYLRDGDELALERLPRVELPRMSDAVPAIEATRRAIEDVLPEPRPRAVTVVLDRDGARLYPGPDMARLGTSSVLFRNGITSLDIPAYQGSDARWRAFTRCVEQRFEGWRVEVLEQPPAHGDYIQVHVGGSPELFGYQSNTRGLAPLTGRVIPNAPVFVFSDGNPSARELCDTAAHEIGHAIGLDHSRLCNDLMSYGECEHKGFRSKPAACGEYEDRDCVDGEPTQSSSEKLERRVGRRANEPGVV